MFSGYKYKYVIVVEFDGWSLMGTLRSLVNSEYLKGTRGILGGALGN